MLLVCSRLDSPDSWTLRHPLYTCFTYLTYSEYDAWPSTFLMWQDGWTLDGSYVQILTKLVRGERWVVRST